MFLHYETEIKKSDKPAKKEMLGHKVVVAKAEGCCLDAITKILKRVQSYSKADLFKAIADDYFDKTGICYDVEEVCGTELDLALIDMLTGEKRVKVLPFGLAKAIMPNCFTAKAVCDDEDEYDYETGKKLADARLAKKIKAAEKKAINSWLKELDSMADAVEDLI